MIVVAGALSLLFIIIGFVITESNAKYLLSGYNTLTEEERKQVDISAYLRAFKKFHLILGIILFSVTTLLYYWTNENVAGVFLVAFPILAYTYFYFSTRNYWKNISKPQKYLNTITIALVLIVVVGIIGYGLRPTHVKIESSGLVIEGMHGETIPAPNIKSLSLVNELPEISWKVNGFSLCGIKKGNFKTKEGARVKLFLDRNEPPFILIETTEGEKIYYSSNESSLNEKLFKELQVQLRGK